MINLTDGSCCRIFGINSTSIDVFKEYFFTHGVFIYKSYGATTEEYENVVSYFRNSQINKKYLFECIPFCKLGSQKLNEPLSNLDKLY